MTHLPSRLLTILLLVASHVQANVCENVHASLKSSFGKHNDTHDRSSSARTDNPQEHLQYLLKNERLVEAAWLMREMGLDKKADALLLKTETYLKEGNIVSTEKLGGGETESYLLRFENGIQAVFKPDPVRSPYPACARCEVTAYNISNLFGFDLVPVTVMRTHGDQTGSLQYFVKDAPTGKKAVVEADKPHRKQYKSLMNFFDLLIANTDRHDGNYLYLNNRTVAIDHGRSFADRYISELTIELTMQQLKAANLPQQPVIMQRLKTLPQPLIKQAILPLHPEEQADFLNSLSQIQDALKSYSNAFTAKP